MTIKVDGVEREWKVGEKIDFVDGSEYLILIDGEWIDLIQWLDECEAEGKG